jgi:hypothetical protein
LLDKYLLPRFGNFLLRDLTPAVLQQYFSVGMTAAHPTLGWESKNKIRDVLASVLKRAVRKYALLERNPMEAIELPPDKIAHFPGDLDGGGGRNVKDVQGLCGTPKFRPPWTQQVPESQRRAIEATSKMAAGRIADAREALRAAANGPVN